MEGLEVNDILNWMNDPEIKAIVLNYNQEDTNVILGKKCETILY